MVPLSKLSQLRRRATIRPKLTAAAKHAARKTAPVSDHS